LTASSTKLSSSVERVRTTTIDIESATTGATLIVVSLIIILVVSLAVVILVSMSTIELARGRPIESRGMSTTAHINVLRRKSKCLTLFDPDGLSEGLLIGILNEMLFILLGMHLVRTALSLELLGSIELNDYSAFFAFVFEV